jgi:hypothetical protein
MPKLKEVDINYDQIRELVRQLKFDKKMALIREIIKERGYKDNFYVYTESLAKKYNIPKMSEEELDRFLREKS